MYKKLICFSSTILFSFIPILVCSGQSEIEITADTITVESGEILKAEGNVIVQNGNNLLKLRL